MKQIRHQKIVSIIVPNYNSEKYIKETIESVLNQTFEDWELLVIDDNSHDLSVKIVKHYVSKDNRISLYERNRMPKGANTCRNVGIEHAEGKYMIFLDSDDLLKNDCLAGRVEYMEQHPHLDFAVFQMCVLNDCGIQPDCRLTHRADNYLYAFLAHELPWPITGPIWNSEFVKNKLMKFDEQFPRLQDPEFHTRALFLNGVLFEVLYDREPDSYYRLMTGKIRSLSNSLIGFRYYLQKQIPYIRYRLDKQICMSKLTLCYYHGWECFKEHFNRKEKLKIISEILKLTCLAYVYQLISIKQFCRKTAIILYYLILKN